MNTRILLIVLAGLVVIIMAASFAYVLSIPEPEVPMTKAERTGMVYDRAVVFLAKGDEANAVKGFTATLRSSEDSKYAEISLKRLAELYARKGDDEKTSYYYRRLLDKFPETEGADGIKVVLDNITMRGLLTPDPERDSIEYVVGPGDSLYAIAGKFNTTVALIKKMNGLTSDTIRIGQKLKISNSKFSVFVDKSDNILILKRDGEPFKTYSVATGENNSTPVGVFTVVDKMVKPVWTKPGVGLISADSEEYELGERWIPISLQGYGIHGTNDELSIGKQATAGCVRMRNVDVVELYDIIPIGTKVEIVD